MSPSDPAQLPLPAGFQADQRAACHADRHEDEAFFVTAGHFTFHAGDRTFVVQASRFRSRPTTSHGTMVLDLDRRLGIEYPDLPE